MCGIAGIYAYHSAAEAPQRAELMALSDALAVRGPDGEGLWESADGAVMLAHRRLAILDLSPAGAQPMHWPSAEAPELSLVFNGEIYNYPTLRRELEQKGVSFRSQSDTEALLHLYRYDGDEMVNKLRGMFAFALWDHRRQRMLLARDSFGIKPLYYANDGRSLRFSSQVLSLLRGKVDRSPDPAGHVGFFLWGSVPDPHSLFLGIRAVPAGHWMVVSADGVQGPTRFLTPHQILQQAAGSVVPSRAVPEVLAQLAEALRETVAAHQLADVPVGVFLSAGLDSSLLASLSRRARDPLGEPVRSLTLGFDAYRGTEHDETPLAEETARWLGTDHQTVWIGRSDFEHESKRLFSCMDQPSLDGVNTWFVSRAAVQAGLKVALSGLGGDELFASYPSFAQIPQSVRVLAPLSRFPVLGAAVGKGFRWLSAGMMKRLTSPKYAGLLEYGGSYEGAYLLRRGLFMPWELPEVMDPEMARAGWQALQTLPALSAMLDGVTAPTARVSALEMSWYMRHQLLRDADWAGMAQSLEIRVPLVDITLLQTAAPLLAACASLPTKAQVVKAAAPDLPPARFHRPKTGFTVPVRDWLALGDSEPAAAAPLERGLRGWARQVYRQYLQQTNGIPSA